ncbi:PREDICTED: trans-L-3-hydroxyproline dehydratase-like [Priapulus caudatus]|uniref:trans-L-3-hydroxyproline dehydratase n=1 Tax=Priapulus caudatus TaxID=37621 RepID=A0ABM1E0P4_PRICU|nr:PREDICTED: trans-L-3-hydroxyproline dehydratase-like [Priapulus caudatus]XP_014665765.1 PREDICTED: trans-L-3-hydroxyproline dehydratase-like [Priapulus caudatus]XP_014665767.1 PREDICTED: trans-L-3-hydroxyproline dehydratase-like [Priapulus caudatus]XP_014665768.1 PREDICTED: trans-L-3-hydroxyproline dehydratase-like [Priapulus caudatus]
MAAPTSYDSASSPSRLSADVVIHTTEMHTGGEPLRIIDSGYPTLVGDTILDKLRDARQNYDQFRTFFMSEPRGHRDMYGAILVEPDAPGADLAVLFTQNEGYGTMCGHAVIALSRYAVDRGIVKPMTPETQVNIQCPCGMVRAYVSCDENGKTGAVRFHSVPAFLFAEDIEVDVEGLGKLRVDISYGGAFYAFLDAAKIGLDVRTSKARDIVAAGAQITGALKAKIKLHHPDSNDLAFLSGTILTDGNDPFPNKPAAQVLVFADSQLDRCPCGSGVTARVALQYKKGFMHLGQRRIYESGTTKTKFTGTAIAETTAGEVDAVVVEVRGRAHYCGSNVFTLEEDDILKAGFLLH